MHREDPNEIAAEERGREGEGEEEGAVGGRDPEACEGEDGQGRRSPPHGGYRGRFGGAEVHREPHGLDPPEPNPMEIPMKLLLKKEEEREKVKKKGQLEEEILKHMKERTSWIGPT